eukprot:g1760.t1
MSDNLPPKLELTTSSTNAGSWKADAAHPVKIERPIISERTISANMPSILNPKIASQSMPQLLPHKDDDGNDDHKKPLSMVHLSKNRKSRLSVGIMVRMKGWTNRHKKKVRERQKSISYLSKYVSRKILNHSLRLTKYEECKSCRYVYGASMIVDVSGFSKLAEELSSGKVQTHSADVGRLNSFKFENLQAKMEFKSALKAMEEARQEDMNTEEQRGHGAEQLQMILGEYFAQITSIVEKYDGDVIRIAGDALIIVFTNDLSANESEEEEKKDALLRKYVKQAYHCACECLKNCDEKTIHGLNMRIHIGVGAGKIYFYRVGGVYGRWESLVVGEPIKQLGVALKGSSRGEACFSLSAWEHIGEKVSKESWEEVEVQYDQKQLKCVKLTELDNDNNLVDEFETEEVKPSPPRKTLLAAKSASSRWTEYVLRHYVPNTILSSSGGMLTAEIRQITTLFLKLDETPEPERESDLDSHFEKFNSMVVAVQDKLFEYDAIMKEVTVDDKGCVIVAGFGLPPIVHPDEPLRCCLAAMKIHKSLKKLKIGCKIGITTGVAFCAVIGGNERSEFAMIGPSVNYAARLMCSAKNEDILVDRETRNDIRSIVFSDAIKVRVKGKDEEQSVYRPRYIQTKMVRQHRSQIGEAMILGREKSFSQLRFVINQFWRLQDGGVVVCRGPMGIGKSTMLANIRTMASQLNIRYFMSGVDPFQSQNPLHPFYKVLHEIFENSPSTKGVFRPRKKNSSASLENVDDSLKHQSMIEMEREKARSTFVRNLTKCFSVSDRQFFYLLNPILDLDIAVNPENMDLPEAEANKKLANLISSILIKVLSGDFPGITFEQNCMIILDSCHFLSEDALNVILKVHQRCSVLFILEKRCDPILDLTSSNDLVQDRRTGSGRIDTLLEKEMKKQDLLFVDVEPWNISDTTAYIQYRFPCETVDNHLACYLHASCGGIAGYTRHALDALKNSNFLVLDSKEGHHGSRISLKKDVDVGKVIQSSELKNAISSELSRIVPPAMQHILRVCACLPRHFSINTLHYVYPVEGTNLQSLQSCIEQLVQLQIISQQSPDSRAGYNLGAVAQAGSLDAVSEADKNAPQYEFHQIMDYRVVRSQMSISNKLAVHKKVATLLKEVIAIIGICGEKCDARCHAEYVNHSALAHHESEALKYYQNLTPEQTNELQVYIDRQIEEYFNTGYTDSRDESSVKLSDFPWFKGISKTRSAFSSVRAKLKAAYILRNSITNKSTSMTMRNRLPETPEVNDEPMSSEKTESKTNIDPKAGNSVDGQHSIASTQEEHKVKDTKFRLDEDQCVSQSPIIVEETKRKFSAEKLINMTETKETLGAAADTVQLERDVVPSSMEVKKDQEVESSAIPKKSTKKKKKKKGRKRKKKKRNKEKTNTNLPETSTTASFILERDFSLIDNIASSSSQRGPLGPLRGTQRGKQSWKAERILFDALKRLSNGQPAPIRGHPDIIRNWIPFMMQRTSHKYNESFFDEEEAEEEEDYSFDDDDYDKIDHVDDSHSPSMFSNSYNLGIDNDHDDKGVVEETFDELETKDHRKSIGALPPL